MIAAATSDAVAPAAMAATNSRLAVAGESEATLHAQLRSCQQTLHSVQLQELYGSYTATAQRTALIEAKTANEKLQASVEGEAEGTRLANNALAFLNQLNSSVPSDHERLALLRFFSEQATLTKQTEHLASGKASLFLTPQDMNLKVVVPSTGTGA